MNVTRLLVFDTKTYDREYLQCAAEGLGIELCFRDFRLEQYTGAVASVCGATAACIFVNDVADRGALAELANAGVRHLALRCAGFNNVDLAAGRELGLTVTRVPAYSPYAVAEHAVALLLTLNRKTHRAFNRVRDLNFSLSGLVGFDLRGKTVGLVGTGKTGQITGEILAGFGMKVLAHDPFPDADWAAKIRAAYVPMEQILAESEVISLHAPLTPETKYLLNAESLSRTRPGVVIINVSRGALIDTTALIVGLKSGHVGGVALDVYEEEEGVFFEDLSGQVLQDDELARLLTFPNVLITAHQAFLTHEALTEISRVTLENVVRVARGEPPLPGTGL